MKINRHNLKRLRKDKLWSQEQLAEASALSLRTIQRVESSGVASMDSIGAIALALDVDSDLLRQEEVVFKPYQHTQMGYLVWVICFLILILISPLPGMPMVGLVLLFVGSIVPMILFFSLNVSVAEDKVRWHFGPRFWKKELPIADIASCKVVRNNVLMGWGIRMLSDGWMYNVSGLLAVEIRLKSGSAIRLGSDEPNYLKEAIDGAIALHNSRAA